MNDARYIKIAKVVLTVLMACSLPTILYACVNGEKDELPDAASQQMIDYYDIDSVKSFHTEIQISLNGVVEALSENSDTGLIEALDDLNDLCDKFIDINVSDVPNSLLPYHEKMIQVAQAIKAFSKNIAQKNMVAAAEELETVKEYLSEAKELLPETSSI